MSQTEGSHRGVGDGRLAVTPKRWGVQRLLALGLLALLLPYAAFAVSAAGAEVLHLFRLAPDVCFRGALFVFVVHVITGTMALLGGALQLMRRSDGRSLAREPYCGGRTDSIRSPTADELHETGSPLLDIDRDRRFGVRR